VYDRGEGTVDLGEKVESQMEWGDGDDLPGEGGDATDEVDVCFYDMDGLGKPGPVKEGPIWVRSDDAPNSYVANLEVGILGTLRVGHLYVCVCAGKEERRVVKRGYARAAGAGWRLLEKRSGDSIGVWGYALWTCGGCGECMDWVWVNVCMHACMYVCMYVCMHGAEQSMEQSISKKH
jgi:hypothetical protein